MDNNELHQWLMRQHAQKHLKGEHINRPQLFALTCPKCHLQVVNQPSQRMS